MLRRAFTIVRKPNEAMKALTIPGTTIVRTASEAEAAVTVLRAHKDRVHAWDTETIGLEVKDESPVGKGYVLCASAFIGPEVNFGTGPRLLIDNYGDAAGVLDYFKGYLEDPDYYKCFHNYGFDRHVIFNHGIDVRGFGGDTMHMARLANPSRGPGSYSLAKLTSAYAKQITKVKKKMVDDLSAAHSSNPTILENLKTYKKLPFNKVKTSMDTLFAKPKLLKSGLPGKQLVTPSTEELHTNPEYTKTWIEYSTTDAELTFYLRESLVTELSSMPVRAEDMSNLWEFYLKYWLPLGECLTEMERVGMRLDLEHMKKIEEQAKNEKFGYLQEFMAWVTHIQPELVHFNPTSPAHLQQLLFAPFGKELQKEATPKAVSEFSDSDSDSAETPAVPVRKSYNMSVKDQQFFPQTRTFIITNVNRTEGEKRLVHMNITGLGLKVVERTASGLPSVDAPALKVLAGDPSTGKYGTALSVFQEKGEEDKGKSCCVALESLLKYKSIETLLNNFICPLQTLVDEKHRIHYSLNLNTETGRLSAKRPNAQNQPALDKDKYKIRQGFTAAPGNLLVVADYGQLELRILAHMTNCKSMLDAFKAGGDFHSRTAMSMYPKIAEAVAKGEVLLEWDKSKGAAPAPLLKNAFAAERKRAKTMNFSIAYGKTAHGFAKDWDCTFEEAQAALNLWYSERKEVKEWQEQVKNLALNKGYTRTLLGRYRQLTDLVRNRDSSKRTHGLRAAINTPIQGGAADVVNAAMVRLHYSKELKDIGWKLLLQIHDEVILEGPEQTAKEALAFAKDILEHPLDEELRVALEVDAKIAGNWYAAK